MNVHLGDFVYVQNQKKHGLDDQEGEDFSPPRKTSKKDQSMEHLQLGAINDTPYSFDGVFPEEASDENINENDVQQCDSQRENVSERESGYDDTSPDEVHVVESNGTGDNRGNKCPQGNGTVNSHPEIISPPEAQALGTPVIVQNESNLSTGTEASVDIDKTFADMSTFRAVVQWIDGKYKYTPTPLQKKISDSYFNNSARMESLKNITLSEKQTFLEAMKNSGELNENQYNELVHELSCQSPATILGIFGRDLLFQSLNTAYMQALNKTQQDLERNIPVVTTGQQETRSSIAFNRADEFGNDLVCKNPLAGTSSSLQESTKQIQQQADGGDFSPPKKLSSFKMSYSNQALGVTVSAQKETHLSRETGPCYNKRWPHPNHTYQNNLGLKSNQPVARSTEQEMNQPVSASDLYTDEELRNLVDSLAGSFSPSTGIITQDGQQEVTNLTVANSTIHVAEAVSAIPFNNGEQCRRDLVSENPLPGTSSASELITQSGQQRGSITHGQQEQHFYTYIENSNSPSQGHLLNNVIHASSNVENPVSTVPQMENKQALISPNKPIMDQFWIDVQRKDVLHEAYEKMNEFTEMDKKIREGGKIFVDLTFPVSEILHANVSGKRCTNNPDRKKFNVERVRIISKILAWLLGNPTNITRAGFIEYQRTNNLGLQGKEYKKTFKEDVLVKYASYLRSRMEKPV